MLILIQVMPSRTGKTPACSHWYETLNVLTMCGASQGLCNRWTSQYDLGITTGGLTFNLDNGTKTHLIFVKLLENTFLGMPKVCKSFANFDISNPQGKN